MIWKYSSETIFINPNTIAFFFSTNYKLSRITIPNIIRYIINILKPFDETYFNKKWIANKEDKNVVVKPRTIGKKPYKESTFKEENNSTIAAIEIAGIPKRKENLTASPLSHPEISAVEIVTPDLETPGKMANAWEKPIKRLCV